MTLVCESVGDLGLGDQALVVHDVAVVEAGAVRGHKRGAHRAVV